MAGGKGYYEGNALVDGMPVCANNWDMKDAWVVCKQLGFASIVDFTTRNKFGAIGNWYGMTNVQCSGEEPTLAECSHQKSSTCWYGYGSAGVICSSDLIGKCILRQTFCEVFLNIF